MVQIARRESGLQCSPPRNGNGRGLFQLAGHAGMVQAMARTEPLLWGWATWEAAHDDCMLNIEVAWRLYLACGLGPWTAPSWPCLEPHWR
jgi:hypothetical protein